MTPIPQHQLCTDCQTEKRALAMGLTGYGCLCIPCYEKRMDNAKNKKPRRPSMGRKTRKDEWAATLERMNWTQEQKCAAGYCLGCEHCNNGRDPRPLDKWEDL
jgi:hypothetical protein